MCLHSLASSAVYGLRPLSGCTHNYHFSQVDKQTDRKRPNRAGLCDTFPLYTDTHICNAHRLHRLTMLGEHHYPCPRLPSGSLQYTARETMQTHHQPAIADGKMSSKTKETPPNDAVCATCNLNTCHGQGMCAVPCISY